MKFNGALYCDKCGEFVGTEESLGYYAYLPRKYCDKCRKNALQEKDKARKQLFRKKRKEESALLKHRVSLLESENKLLEDIIVKLKEQLNAMNR